MHELLRPPGVMGDKGTCHFYLWEHRSISQFLGIGNKGSKECFSRKWGTFGISFWGAFKKIIGNKADFLEFLGNTRTQTPWGASLLKGLKHCYRYVTGHLMPVFCYPRGGYSLTFNRGGPCQYLGSQNLC